VLAVAMPAMGHFLPIKAIAKALVARGFDVTFVTGNAFRDHVEETGASLVSLSGYGDFPLNFEDALPERAAVAPGPDQLVYDFENLFVKSIPSHVEAMQKAMKAIEAKDPGRPVVVVGDGSFMGTTASILGATNPSPTAHIGIGLFPLILSSADTAPFGPGLPPDSSPEGRKRNVEMTKGIHEGVFGGVQQVFNQTLKSVGAKKTDHFFLDACIALPDRYIQMCIPSVEYPRSDAPPNIVFAGGLPRADRDPYTAEQQPSWWKEVSTNPEKKRIVAVCQGTVVMDYSTLIIPTMTALKDHDDVLVVVALGRKGATLPADIHVPSNARIADFIPYDELLPCAEVFVTNGGYGGFQRAISHGCPLVVAGASQDKPEVAARADWAGLGVNLKTGSPTVEAVKEAVTEVLSNDKYRERARVLEKEMKTYDPVTIIAEHIMQLGEVRA